MEEIMKVFYNNKYAASKYAFDTTRKSLHIAGSMIEYPIQGATLTDPTEYEPVAEEIVGIVHSDQYVKDVKTGGPLGGSQGFTWDPGIYTMALAHASGLVGAVEAVHNGDPVAGSLSSGLHHADHDGGAGFCTFNGLAVAAMRATDLGYRNIAIIDFDAHGGGGTYSITQKFLPDTTFQVDVVVSAFDTYSVKDSKSNINILKGSSGDRDYMDAITNAMGIVAKNRPDFIIYNAGMDPINAGYSRHSLAYREELVAEVCLALEVPTIFALAGGYTWGSTSMDELVNLHRLTIRSFAESTLPKD
jgi:acetoin utilization deacetylase AcuC-like enzyme